MQPRVTLQTVLEAEVFGVHGATCTEKFTDCKSRLRFSLWAKATSLEPASAMMAAQKAGKIRPAQLDWTLPEAGLHQRPGVHGGQHTKGAAISCFEAVGRI